MGYHRVLLITIGTATLSCILSFVFRDFHRTLLQLCFWMSVVSTLVVAYTCIVNLVYWQTRDRSLASLLLTLFPIHWIITRIVTALLYFSLSTTMLLTAACGLEAISGYSFLKIVIYVLIPFYYWGLKFTWKLLMPRWVTVSHAASSLLQSSRLQSQKPGQLPPKIERIKSAINLVTAMERDLEEDANGTAVGMCIHILLEDTTHAAMAAALRRVDTRWL